MRLLDYPPPGWDERIAFPTLAVGFAEASRHLAYRPLYVESEDNTALVLVRSVPLPLLGSWTRRAKIYLSRTDGPFLRTLVEKLGAMGIASVRIGDSAWGMQGAIGWPPIRPVVRHVFLHDLTLPESQHLAQMKNPIPTQIRRAAREGVTVREVRTDEDMRHYCRLLEETIGRMRERGVTAIYPEQFFWTVFREMVPRGQALFLLAWADSVALAGGMFLTSHDRLTYYMGGSTRDRALTGKQGPTAMFWHAMRLGQRRGLKTFDMAAVTPTQDRSHPNRSVYLFKRDWGGTLTEVYTGEAIISPTKHYFQERVLSRVFDFIHPIYLTMFARASREPTGR